MATVACAAIGLGGCGGAKPVPGAGKGIGYGLRAAGMQLCVGPLPGEADTSPASAPAAPVSLSLYAEEGLAALVASGASAQQHAVDMLLIRYHVQSNVSAAEIADTESSWRREAVRALNRQGVPPGPCRSQASRLPVLGQTEVVCPDQVLIPLGRPDAMDRFGSVLSKLLGVHVTPTQYIPSPDLGEYPDITISSSVNVSRPYCHGN